MPINPTAITQVFSDHWPQVVFGYAVLRDAAKPVAKYLRDHYRHDSNETLEQAAVNASDLAHRLEAKVRTMLETGELTNEQLSNGLNRPDLAKTLQRAFLDASESSSEFQHEQLAQLVSTSLATPGESFQSRLLRIATERVRSLTDRQLKLLGLIHTIEYTGFVPSNANASVQEQYREYVDMCQALLDPYADVEFNWLDFGHLEALALIKVGPRFTGIGVSHSGFNAALAQPIGLLFNGLFQPLGTVEADPIIKRLMRLVHGKNPPIDDSPLSTLTMLPAGDVIGMAVQCSITGTQLDISQILA